ncbi:MAG: AtpZ/AtpI family protein [Hyphomicrobiaceae bacterium]
MSRSGQNPGPTRRDLSPEEQEALRQRASALGKRLDQVKARKAPPPSHQNARGRAFGEAFKIVAELVVGVAVGGGIGWFLDRQFGSTPWLLVLFLILGFAGGLLNVIRIARQMQREAEPLQRAARPVADDDEDR